MPLFTVLVVATIGVLVAGVVSVAALSGSASNSPQDAVRALMQATASGNATAALAAVDPAEASAIGPALTTLVGALQKLGVFDPNLNLSNLDGISITFDNATMQTSTVDPSRPDLAAVTFTGGTVTARVDVAQLALGGLVKDALAGRSTTFTKSVPLAAPGRPPVSIITVQRNGQWYVSIGYTLAAAALAHAGVPLSSAPSPIVAAGATSADAAARQFLAAAVQRDPRAAIALLDPTDSAALHDYGSALLAPAPASAPPAVTVSSLDLGASPVEGGTLETVTSFTATAGTTTVSLSGGCLQIASTTSAAHQVCAPAGSNLAAGLGLVAVQRGSSWYIDPYRTVLDDLDRVVSGADLSALIGQLGGGGGGPLAWLGLGALGSSSSACAAPVGSGAPCPTSGLTP
jgi:hypothetical protein